MHLKQALLFMDQDSIKNECMRLWQHHFARVLRKCQYDPAFTDMLDKYEWNAEIEATDHLQPWLQILNDSIQWLANLTGILDRSLKSNSPAPLRTAWALIGASCAHAVALRRLVLSGLDSGAKAILRVLDEHLMACILFLYEPELAAEFQSKQDDEEAKIFWHEHLNAKSLRNRLSRMEDAVGIDNESTRAFLDWRKEEIRLYSQSIHPSYGSAALTVMTLCASNPQRSRIAFLGQASLMSERTLEYACKIIWYFSRFGYFFLYNEFNGNSPYITLEPDDEMHQVVVIGHEVLDELNSRYWEYSRKKQIQF